MRLATSLLSFSVVRATVKLDSTIYLRRANLGQRIRKQGLHSMTLIGENATYHGLTTEVSLVDTDLREFLKTGNIKLPSEPSASPDLFSYIQPASIDIPLSSECYLVKEKVLPFNQNVRDILPSLTISKISLDEGTVMLKGQTYLVYCGKVTMPSSMRGSLSPKSSIGRVDLMVRAIFDNCGLYDTIPNGKSGELWMEVSPRSFNVKLKHGLALSQLMVFKTAFCKQESHKDLHEEMRSIEQLPSKYDPTMLLSSHQLSFSRCGEPLEPVVHRGAMVFSLSVPNHCGKCYPDSSSNKLIGFEALPTNEVVDLSKVGAHDSSIFFRPIANQTRIEEGSKSGTCSCDVETRNGGGRITLEKDKFYILATRERISVPVNLSAEMIPFSQHVGELRAHYAGFFDPGFGYGKSGETKGTVGVLEVRPHETITVYDGQPICLMEFYENTKEPQHPYGDAGNNYHRQDGPKLAKYFK